MAELKPCPFCGGEAEVNSHFSTVYERIYGVVRCECCGVEVEGDKSFNTMAATMEHYDTPEWVRNAHKEARRSAIEAWNRRISDGNEIC